MVARKLRHHCSTCGLQFDRPQGWAYCSKDCERGRRGLDRTISESGVDSWLDRIYERRLALGRRLEVAMPWEREELQSQIAATHAEESAMREQLAALDAPRTSAMFWQPLVEREADRFETAMRKSLVCAIRLGKRLVEAKAALEHGEFGRLFAGHPQAVEGALTISPRWARVLMSIASNRSIANGKHASVLPADITSVQLLARLPEAELEAAIAAGTVRPDMRREDVRRLLPASEEPDEVEEPQDDAIGRALGPLRAQLIAFAADNPGQLRDLKARLRAMLRNLERVVGGQANG